VAAEHSLVLSLGSLLGCLGLGLRCLPRSLSEELELLAAAGKLSVQMKLALHGLASFVD